MKKAASLVLKIVVAVGLISYLIHSGHLDPKGLWGLMTVPNVCLALFLVGVNIFLATWRWIYLLRSCGFEISSAYGFSLYLIGIFFNHALPGAVGGDLVRGYYLVADHQERKVDSVLSVLIDRILGLYSYFFLTLFAVAWDFEFVLSHEPIRWVATLCFGLFLAMTVFFVILFSRRLSQFFGLHFFEKRVAVLHKVVVGFQRFGQSPKTIAVSVLISVVAQIVCLLFFYAFAQMSGESAVTWKSVLFAVPMGFLVTAIPISPAGVGVGQVAFLYLFQTYLQKQTQFGAASITAFQLSIACWGILGALFYLRRRGPHELDRIVSSVEAV